MMQTFGKGNDEWRRGRREQEWCLCPCRRGQGYGKGWGQGWGKGWGQGWGQGQGNWQGQGWGQGSQWMGGTPSGWWQPTQGGNVWQYNRQ